MVEEPKSAADYLQSDPRGGFDDLLVGQAVHHGVPAAPPGRLRENRQGRDPFHLARLGPVRAQR